jgi:hypothetical protein
MEASTDEPPIALNPVGGIFETPFIRVPRTAASRGIVLPRLAL